MEKALLRLIGLLVFMCFLGACSHDDISGGNPNVTEVATQEGSGDATPAAPDTSGPEAGTADAPASSTAPAPTRVACISLLNVNDADQVDVKVQLNFSQDVVIVGKEIPLTSDMTVTARAREYVSHEHVARFKNDVPTGMDRVVSYGTSSLERQAKSLYVKKGTLEVTLQGICCAENVCGKGAVGLSDTRMRLEPAACTD